VPGMKVLLAPGVDRRSAHRASSDVAARRRSL
jgi:hypothetical protein